MICDILKYSNCDPSFLLDSSRASLIQYERESNDKSWKAQCHNHSLQAVCHWLKMALKHYPLRKKTWQEMTKEDWLVIPSTIESAPAPISDTKHQHGVERAIEDCNSSASASHSSLSCVQEDTSAAPLQGVWMCVHEHRQALGTLCSSPKQTRLLDWFLGAVGGVDWLNVAILAAYPHHNLLIQGNNYALVCVPSLPEMVYGEIISANQHMIWTEIMPCGTAV